MTGVQTCALPIYTDSKEEADRLDTLIWTFKEESFIPHNLYQPDEPFPPAIQIGCDITPNTHRDLLINLNLQIPLFYTQFSHVIEIVFSDPHVQQLARERYRQYREQGHELNTLKIKLASHD